MKKIKIEKKLQLNKKTIAALNPSELEAAKGGRLIFESASVCATGPCICDFVSEARGCGESLLDIC